MKPNSDTHTEIPSSLMIYPIPYPSAATGPKPNSLNAGFPQFDVDNIDVFSVAHPPSRNISGSAGPLDELQLTSELVSSSRWRRQ